jgi:fructose/tagatose bisphosphate aldolase
MVVHLDHATDASLVDDAIELGFGSVMFDASTMPYTENVAATPGIVRRCHDRGLDVETELGEIGGKDGVHARGPELSLTRRGPLLRQPGWTRWQSPWGPRTQ